MKIDALHVFIMAVALMCVGLMFGLFTKLTGIPTFYPSVAVVIVYSLGMNPAVFVKPGVLCPLILFLVLMLYDAEGHFNGIPEVVLRPFGIFTLVWPYFLAGLVLENIISLKRARAAILILGKFSFILIIIIILVSLTSECMFPGVTRNLSPAHKLTHLPKWVWTLTFGTYYAMPMILTPIIVCYNGKRVYLFMIVGLFLAAAIRGGFLAALAITLLSAMLGVALRMSSRRKMSAIMGVGILMWIAANNFSAIIDLMPRLPNTIYQRKAEDLSTLQMESSIIDKVEKARDNVYGKSLDAFRQDYFLGTGSWDEVGGHSYLLDRLGFIGILGTAFYMFVLFILYKRASVLIHPADRVIYRFMCVLVLLFLFANPSDWVDFWFIIFVLVPCIINYLRTIRPDRAI